MVSFFVLICVLTVLGTVLLEDLKCQLLSNVQVSQENVILFNPVSIVLTVVSPRTTKNSDELLEILVEC